VLTTFNQIAKKDGNVPPDLHDVRESLCNALALLDEWTLRKNRVGKVDAESTDVRKA
jgi:hypothetical protein